MKDAGDGGGIGEPVQCLPAPPAQTPDHTGGGRRRKRSDQQQGDEADGKKWAEQIDADCRSRFDRCCQKVSAHCSIQRRDAIEKDVGGSVQYTVEEPKKAQHPAELHHGMPACEPSKRCDRQREAEKAQRPVPCASDDSVEVDNVALAGESIPEQQCQRAEARGEN